MQGNNGITKAQNDTIYVASSMGGGVSILERQQDNTLVLSENIKTGNYPRNIESQKHSCLSEISPTDRLLDNIAVDANGALWVAGQ
jgi:arylesterase/paraoxonase